MSAFVCVRVYFAAFAHRNNLVSILTMEIIQFHAVDASDCDLQAKNIQHSVS